MRWAWLVVAFLLLCPSVGAKQSPCVVPEGLDAERVSASYERSEGLGQDLCVLVASPAGERPAELVIIALHGLFAGSDQWLTSGALLKRVDRLTERGALPPTAVVAPEGRAGYWTDWADKKHPWGSWVAQELTGEILRKHGLPQGPEQTALIGLSMGGFGALSLGLRYPKAFGMIAALSPTDMELATHAQPKRKTYTNVFGAPLDKKRVRALNPRRLVAAGAGRDQLVLVAWGDREPKKFSAGARRLRKALRKAGVQSAFLEVPGGKHSFAKTWGPATIDWVLKGLARHVSAGKKSAP